MALDLLNDATNTLAATSLGQQVIETFNNGVDQMLLDNGIDTLNVQDLQRIIVQSDSDDEYQKQMEELQKKLKQLEKEKEEKRQEAIRQRQQREQEEQKRKEEEEKRNRENYFQRRWDDVVDDVEHPGHFTDNIGKDFEDTVDTLEEDEKEVSYFVRKLPDRSYQIWQKMLVLKWIINLWAVGVPWCFVLLVIFSWNFYVNIFWNKFWAEGNVFLMANTLYIWIQALISLPLMFEIPALLKFIKPFRILSLWSAIIYNIMFIGSIADFFYIGQAEEKSDFEDEGQFFGDVMLSLFIFYNLVENFPIVIINCGIMLKEALLPFFQLVTNARAPSEKDRVQLSLLDIEELILLFVNLANPAYTLRALFKLILGWDPADMVIENKNDEDHYYAGKAYRGIKDKLN